MISMSLTQKAINNSNPILVETNKVLNILNICADLRHIICDYLTISWVSCDVECDVLTGVSNCNTEQLIQLSDNVLVAGGSTYHTINCVDNEYVSNILWTSLFAWERVCKSIRLNDTSIVCVHRSGLISLVGIENCYTICDQQVEHKDKFTKCCLLKLSDDLIAISSVLGNDYVGIYNVNLLNKDFGRCVKVLECIDCTCLLKLSDGIMISGHKDGCIKLWNINTNRNKFWNRNKFGTCLKTIKPVILYRDNNSVKIIKKVSKGVIITVTHCSGKKILFWDVDAKSKNYGKCVTSIKLKSRYPIQCIELIEANVFAIGHGHEISIVRIYKNHTNGTYEITLDNIFDACDKSLIIASITILSNNRLAITTESVNHSWDNICILSAV